MQILEKDSLLSIQSDFTFSSTDEEVLSLLYLPIVKHEAYSLYHALFSYSLLGKDFSALTHESLSQMLGMDFVSLLESRKRLEAIGLLDTYRKEEKDVKGGIKVLYLYRLLPPATPKKFFDDVLLRTALSSLVSSKEYFRLKSYFKIGHDQVSEDFSKCNATFSSVYTLSVDKDSLSLVDNGIVNIEKSYKKQSTFSMKKVFENLKTDNFKTTEVEKEKQEIENIAILYGIDEQKVTDLIEKNMTIDSSFSLSSFIQDVKMTNQYTPVSHEENSTNLQIDGKMGKLIEGFQRLTPVEYLSYRFNAKPSSFMLEAIERIKQNTGLSNPVLNVVLDYSLRKTNGEFNATFIEKVAYTLSASGATSAYEAMMYLNSRDFEKSKRKKKSPMDEKEDLPSKKEEKDVSIDDILTIEKEIGI